MCFVLIYDFVHLWLQIWIFIGTYPLIYYAVDLSCMQIHYMPTNLSTVYNEETEFMLIHQCNAVNIFVFPLIYFHSLFFTIRKNGA